MRSRSVTPAATNGAMKPPRPPCIACDSSHDECAFGVTIRTCSDGTSAIRRASASRDLGRAGELVLDIDETAGRIDRGLEQPGHFVDARLATRFSVRSVRSRPGSASPPPAPRRASDRPRRFADFHRATGGRPSRHRDLAERNRGLALDHALDVVEWRIRLAVGIAAQRMVGEMLAGVPAPDRQIEPAGEGNRVVDHDDLLMLGRSQRKAGVEAEPDPPLACRRELGGGIPFPLGRIQRREIPDQDVDPQRRACARASPFRNGPSAIGRPSSDAPDGPTSGVSE